MKQNKKQKIIFIIIAAVLVLAGVGIYFYQVYGSKGDAASGLIRKCPDSWIQNSMPSAGPDSDKGNSQYLIVNGHRAEVADYDMDWIASNCSVKMEKVY